MCGEIFNNLTQRLDELSDRQRLKEENPEFKRFYSHYLYEARRDFGTGAIAIRVPGGTVGSVFVDSNGIISHINIATDYVVSYSDNINKIINNEFIGKKLEL